MDSTWITVVFGVIILGTAWSLIREGIWGATLVFLEILIAGLVAMNFFEPLAGLMEDYLAFMAGYEDGVALLLVFGLVLFIFREADGALWPNMVRFPGLLHRAGGAAFGVLSGLALAAFLLCAFQAFPLPTSFMGYNSEEKMVLGLGLDRHWLAFTQRMSRKALRQGDGNTFDPDARFIDMYKLRRALGVKADSEEEAAAPAEGAPEQQPAGTAF